jgi:hypothetical protein
VGLKLRVDVQERVKEKQQTIINVFMGSFEGADSDRNKRATVIVIRYEL